MAYLTWGLIALQFALIGYQVYVYKQIGKVDSSHIKGLHFFSGYAIVILEVAITAIVITLNAVKQG